MDIKQEVKELDIVTNGKFPTLQYGVWYINNKKVTREQFEKWQR